MSGSGENLITNYSNNQFLMKAELKNTKCQLKKYPMKCVNSKLKTNIYNVAYSKVTAKTFKIFLNRYGQTDDLIHDCEECQSWYVYI